MSDPHLCKRNSDKEDLETEKERYPSFVSLK